MGSIDSLPADQRAVLELVLRRGRTYDEIASLLSIDRAGVRQRALAGLDALGPKTRVRADRRALITDYLLDALPAEVAGEVRNHLESSAGERAWARAVASELQPLSEQPLPEIPSNGHKPQAKPAEGKAAGRTRATRQRTPKADVPVAAALSNGAPRERSPQRVSSRVGGAVLLGVSAAVVIALVLVFVVFTGGSKPHHPTAAAAHHATTTTASSAAKSAKIVAEVELKPPSGAKSPVGLAEIITLQGKIGVALAAEGLAPNKKAPKDYYAVWLSNGGSSNELLGVASTPVASNGVLRTAGGLPTNASNYHKLLVTLETSTAPKTPGTVVLEGSGKL